MAYGIMRETKLVDGVQYNKCTKCGKWLEATDKNFHNKKDPFGLRAECKQCMNKLSRSKYHENIEERRTERRKYKNKPERKIKAKLYYKENKDKIQKRQKKWREKNAQYLKEYREENKDKIYAKRKEHYQQNKETYKKQTIAYMKSTAKYVTYIGKLTTDEDPKEGKNGLLLVQCTYCGRYYTPKNREVLNRISVLTGENSYGEARLYCSEGCKDACSIFNKQWNFVVEKKQYTREVDPELIKMALALDNYECQRCGKSIDEISLHVHHIQPYALNKMLANDIDNTITFCIKCHLGWMHTKDGYGCIDTKCDP